MAAATGVSLDKSTLSLKVGESERLTATVAPSDADDKTVSWSSSDTSIATVTTAGLVAAKAKGTAEITATSTDGAFTAKATVSVAEVAGVVEIVFQKNMFYGLEGSKTTLLPTVLPEGSASDLTWSSSDEEVATVSENGEVTAVKLGKAQIRAEAENGVHVVVDFLVVDKNKQHELEVRDHLMSVSRRELSGYFQVLNDEESNTEWK